ncbi:hypothetical protein KRX56_06150 [Dermabacteraceae bacterium TAE3-ERU27]|nr:hypothetical protein [Dermabacteraceae bacterium TAE3-ERU27]
MSESPGYALLVGTDENNIREATYMVLGDKSTKRRVVGVPAEGDGPTVVSILNDGNTVATFEAEALVSIARHIAPAEFAREIWEFMAENGGEDE